MNKNISPRVIVNKKNFVFGESINILNSEKLNNKKKLIIRNNNSNSDLQAEESRSVMNQRSKADIPNFNPFEISSQNHPKRFIKQVKNVDTRSNSDIIDKNCFLNRVESLSDSKKGRRSDIVHHNNPFSSTIKNLYNEYNQMILGGEDSCKISPESQSNKESSNSNSVRSSEVGSNLVSPPTYKINKQLQKQQESNNNVRKFTDEHYNPFAIYEPSHFIVEESDEE